MVIWISGNTSPALFVWIIFPGKTFAVGKRLPTALIDLLIRNSKSKIQVHLPQISLENLIEVSTAKLAKFSQIYYLLCLCNSLLICCLIIYSLIELIAVFKLKLAQDQIKSEN